MASRSRHFDLALAYPQWQGSGRASHLPRGAAAAAAICANYAPLATVPLSDDLTDGFGVNRWGGLLAQFEAAQRILRDHAPQRVLTAGGDCAADIAVIDYLNARHDGLTVVWVDAHLDSNTPETSPSGNLHGMPVAAIMGAAPPPLQALMGAPVVPERFFYVGVRKGGTGEVAFRERHGLADLAGDQVLTGPVHIHFDLDALEPSEFPHLAFPEPGGLTIADAIALVRRIAASADVVGLTITEFAPADEDAAREGSAVIAALCDAVHEAQKEAA